MWDGIGEVVATGSALVTAVGVVVAASSLQQAKRQRVRTFEDLYVQRYWALIDSLSLKALRGEDELDDNDEKVIRGYLMLCEDELDLRAQGWISDRTWKMWSDGIRDQLQQKAFKKVWDHVQVEQQDAHRYASLHSLLGDGADPYGTGHWWQRRARGLRGWFNQ